MVVLRLFDLSVGDDLCVELVGYETEEQRPARLPCTPRMEKRVEKRVEEGGDRWKGVENGGKGWRRAEIGV